MLIKQKKLLRLIRKEIRKLKRQRDAINKYDYSTFNFFYKKVKRLEVPFSFSKVWGVYDVLYEGYSYPWGSVNIKNDKIISQITTEQFSLLVLMKNLNQKINKG